MYIVLDSNVWVSDFWAVSQHMRMLLDYAHKTYAEVLLIDAVELEVKAHVYRRLSGATKQVAAALNAAERLRIPNLPTIDLNAITEQARAEWLAQWERTTRNPPVRKVPITVEAAQEAVRRSAERLPPCHNKAEYRDALIWIGALDFVQDPPTPQELVLISANTRDFGAADDRGTLHPDLLDEAEKRDIKARLYPSLEAFVSDHAARFAYLTVQWVEGRLDPTDVADMLKADLTSRSGINYHTTSFFDDADDAFQVRSLKRVDRVDVHIEDVFIWEFDEAHTEISISGWAYIEAEAECERTLHPPWMPRSYEEYERMEWEYPRYRSATVYAEVGFDVAASVSGDDIVDPMLDDVYNL